MKKVFLLILVFCNTMVFSQNFNSKLKPTIEELREFISIPNDALVSEDILKNIEWLSKKFKDRGFKTTIIKTEGQPLFFAELPKVTNAKTILFYMHLDGQSVEPRKWDQDDPYKAVLKTKNNNDWKTLDWSEMETKINENWRIFGRSASDDKGPIVMFLNTIDLLKENNTSIPFNVKVILDSEEEKSSKPLPKAVKDNRDLLAADYLIINDGPLHVSDNPTLAFGCRGITTINLTTYGPIKPQHSGHYGNYAPNPGFILSKLLASFKDDNGKVTIDGYYDGITIDQQTLDILKSVPDNRQQILENLAVKTPETVGDFYQEALQYPSLNIRGLSSGWTGKKARTIVPATATAAIDIRLVPESDGQRLKELIRQHIETQGFYITDKEPTMKERLQHNKILTFESGSVTNPFRTDMTLPFATWLENVMTTNNDDTLVKIRIMGGTVPISPFINELNIPAILVPLVNPDNNQHSPNENLKIKNIKYGLQTFYNILSTPLD
ncbi:MAG: M20/M25/M40 family metallo-hydrolase [Flavobacteriaceae bacterium]|nr:M20/M25/M40 family metallo-hydrolase [Flavobacteriaceae bacterium]